MGLPSERIIYALMVAGLRAMKMRGLIKGADGLASSAQAAQLIGGPSNDLLAICTSLKVNKRSMPTSIIIHIYFTIPSLGSKWKGYKEITVNGLRCSFTKISKFKFNNNPSIHPISENIVVNK